MMRSTILPVALVALLAGTAAAQGVDSTATDSAAVPARAAAAQQAPRDAWGVEKNGAMAVGELLMVNGFVWAMNEYLGGVNWTQTNPRAWYEHFKNGWQYDDNLFTTNFIAHPFHGNLYFNTARANGFNFWASIPFSFAGSFFWECCGESHEPAINDWINTSVGGTTIGEALYRISSTVLDNTSTGGERTRRELAAGLLNPVRGVTRLIQGQTHGVRPNPTRPADYIPDRLFNSLQLGARYVVDDGPFDDAKSTGGFFGVDFDYGDAAAVEKPFDHFRMQLQLNGRDKKILGAWAVRGDLVTANLKEREGHTLQLGATLNYEYFNNNAFEFGGQSVSGFLRPTWALSPSTSLTVQAALDAQLFGSVNSEFAFLAPVPPGQTRIREYDMGVGGGTHLAVQLSRRGRLAALVGYRVIYLEVLNGSEGTVVGFGDIDGSHVLQDFIATLRLPVRRSFGLGADFAYHQRNSRWNNANVTDISQFVRVLKFYATWEVGRGITGGTVTPTPP